MNKMQWYSLYDNHRCLCIDEELRGCVQQLMNGRWVNNQEPGHFLTMFGCMSALLRAVGR